MELALEVNSSFFPEIRAYQGLTNPKTSCMLECNEGIEQSGNVAL